MKILAFDLGRVIFDFDYSIAFKKLEKKLKVSSVEIIDILMRTDFTIDFEKGLINTFDFYNKFKNAFGPTLEFKEFIDSWQDIFSPKQEVINLIQALKQHYPTYLISNINEVHFEYLFKEYPLVFSLFNNLVLSYKVNAVKPEEKIFTHLRKVTNSHYENIIYIDDRQDLIEPVRQLKLNCIQFNNFDQLVKDLVTYGIKIPELKNFDVKNVL